MLVAWTVTTLSEVLPLRDRGVDLAICDDPAGGAQRLRQNLCQRYVQQMTRSALGTDVRWIFARRPSASPSTWNGSSSSMASMIISG